MINTSMEGLNSKEMREDHSKSPGKMFIETMNVQRRKGKGPSEGNMSNVKGGFRIRGRNCVAK